MKVINKGSGLKHVGNVTLAPNEVAEIDDNWESAISGDLQKVDFIEPEQSEETPAKRGRPAKLKEAE